ncbi:hypothetical protein LC668_07855 (plasmid) [Fusobacterium vincentii]|uniref:hypothetical protein n=2 Tax=Fusobacteriaceae TaxID=203492 RepID=UPI00324B66A1|nr:hypothetical protein [Fusobacterium nucleatum]
MIVANYLFKEKKKSIKKEINDLISFLEEKYRKLDEREKNFVRFLSKHIIFFKNFSDLENNFEIKLLISDFYYFIISYLNLEGRYVALNLRSIIENYIRLLLNKVSEEYHIEHNSFIELKEKYNLSNDDNSLVYDTYIKSCRYIHGGKVLKETLKLDIENLKENSSDKMIDSFEAVEKLLKTLDKLLMKNHLILILIERDFHRKRRLIEILLGKEIYNIFSENLKEV